MNNLIQMSLVIYFSIQVFACVFLSIRIDEVYDELKEGLTLYHLILVILLLPAIIVLSLSSLLSIGLFILWTWLSKLKNIKIYKRN
jgi:hypothetical protein